MDARRRLLERYLEGGFPIIPLGARSKAPTSRGWAEDSYPREAFRGGNIGTRAGERVCIDGKDGHLLIIDYDHPDIGPLRALCAALSLPRTTCVRTGGQHRGYHLYYLTPMSTRKRGMLLYRGASIDLLGKGSFAVVPPSVVERPYRYLVGLDELAAISEETYDALVHELRGWKRVETLVRQVVGGRTPLEKAELRMGEADVSSEMQAYFREAIANETIPPD